MRQIERHLETILRHLDVLQRPVISALNPGLAEPKIQKAFLSENLHAPRDVVDLWHWRNGTKILPHVTKLDDIQFFPGFYFFSMEDALEQYRAMRNDRRWDPRWVPLFASGGGDFYAVQLDRSDPTSSLIVGFLLGVDEHPIEYQSVEKMCETIATCFERGVFFVTPEGYLDMDDAGHTAIARQINPDVELWQSG
jgi:hypothetical protein